MSTAERATAMPAAAAGGGSAPDRAVTRAQPRMGIARILDYLPLLKIPVIVVMTLTGVVSAIVAGDGHVPTDKLLLFTLFSLMASGGAAALNHLFERNRDPLMERTRNRPIPAGLVTPKAAAILATVLLAIAIPGSWILLNWSVALQWIVALIIYSFIYTIYLKPRTWWNTVLGGISGGNVCLAGWAVVDPSLHMGGWLLALLIILWSPPHFWPLAIARDEDYRSVGYPMAPQALGVKNTCAQVSLYALATWVTSVALVYYTSLGTTYLVAANLLGSVFTGVCFWLWAKPSKRLAMAVFSASNAYVFLVFVVMVIDLWVRK